MNITGIVHDGIDAERRFGYIAQRAERTGTNLKLIAVSESVRQQLVGRGASGCWVRTICNGLDVSDFQSRLRLAEAGGIFERVRERNNLPAGHRIVLVSARRVPWKGHEDVIRAAHQLDEQGLLHGVCVVFNGAGLLDTRFPAYENDLTRLIADLGLSHRVFLLDELSAEEVASCYGVAHVAAHPSREPEPFGYANVEAMLAAVPIIATRHGGPSHYIDHGRSGLLVPPRDPAALAAALQRLLADDALHARLGQAGRASAERFALDAMIDGYEAVITAGTGSPAAVGVGVR